MNGKTILRPALLKICLKPREIEATQLGLAAFRGLIRKAADEEAINTPFCPLQEKFDTLVLRGPRKIPP